MRLVEPGRLRLTGPNPLDPVEIEANLLSHPDDLSAAIACVELCREIGNSTALRPFARREVMPGNLKGAALEDFTCDAAMESGPPKSCEQSIGRNFSCLSFVLFCSRQRSPP
ncbi:MAG TPA: GMC oxidoreductase [Ktedonobacteraceae bacterium]|nr:GMC oxidoreductase [Ktedonobacteraceae bacterium]